MRGLAIYLEGGGDSTEQKAKIRQGMGEFLSALRDRARTRRFRWKVISCGGRNAARDAFTHALETEPETYCVLLVDSEDQVDSTPIQHLRTRDGWTLPGTDGDQIHLMVRAMESWIVADPDALAAYYGQRFRPNALPAALDLESVPKVDVAHALEQATRDTQKGRYQKIRHGADLLARINPVRVEARCGHCRRLRDRLTTVLDTL